MTAPFLSRFGTPITPPAAVMLLGQDALAHLKRPIRHSIPGALWGRVAESGDNLEAEGTPCIMCRGSKVYPYHPASGATVWGKCAACHGTGIDHD